jgi:SlyX protein
MSRDLEDRVTELEVQLAHTQHLFDQLNAVVTEQAIKIDRISRAIGKLRESVDDLKHKSEEKLDPLDDKPPHY